MSYGLKFNGDNGQLIFNSSVGDNDTQTFIITESDTIPNGDSKNIPTDCLLFGRVNSGNLYGSRTYSSQNTFTNNSGQQISVIVARPANSASDTGSGGSYGLELYGPDLDANNNLVVTFSTRKVGNSTLNFQQVFDHDSISDQEVLNTGSTTNLYISLNYGFYSSNNQIETIINGWQWSSNSIKYIGYRQEFSGDSEREEITNKGTIALVKIRTS